MVTLIGWFAIIGLLFFGLFVLKRVLGLLFRRAGSKTPLHEDLADVAEDIAGASKIAAVLGTAAAWFVAPAGLLAVAAALGLAPKPLIVILLPVLLAFSAGAYALSAAAKLYAKAIRKRKQIIVRSK